MHARATRHPVYGPLTFADGIMISGIVFLIAWFWTGGGGC